MDKKTIISIVEFFCILFLLLFVGSGVVVNPFLGDVNVIDEGQFGAWASHMLRGEYLYQDTYTAYGPLYIYPLYVLSKIFGPSVFLIRILYLVINTFLAIVIVRSLLKKLNISYVLQLCTLALLLIVPGFGMRQGIGLLAILMTYYALERKDYRWSLVGGVSIASAYLISPEIGLFSTAISGGLFLYLILIARRVDILLKKLLCTVGGMIIVFLSFFIFSSSQGWFSSYLLSTLDTLFTYTGMDIPNGKGFPNAFLLMPDSLSPWQWMKYIVSKEILLYWQFFFYVIASLYFFTRMVMRIFNKEDMLALLVTVYGFFLALILIGRSGHFPFTLSPIFILFAYFVNRLINSYHYKKAKGGKVVAILCILLISLFSVRIVLMYRPHFKNIFLVPETVITDKITPRFVGPVSISQAQAQSFRTIQKFIAENTSPSDSVFFFNNEPIMYLLTNRDNPTRYDLPEVANTKEKRFELLNDLVNDKTRFIIDDAEAWSVDGVSNRRRLPEVTKYIEENYTKRVINNFTIYERKKN